MSLAEERITVLLPCKDQREDFLRDAVESILSQSSPRWELLVGLEDGSASTHAMLEGLGDPRVRVLPEAGPGFARTLNQMIEAAHTPFVSILLSDDRYASNAVETLLRYRERHPEADFFHSSRRYMDVSGTHFQEPFPSKETFDLDHFKRAGSPVKHLLCWRRDLALQIGGMDESLSRHGCDDFDFPWSMAEAGARFQAVSECLYEYRVHNEGPRLTTGTPLQTQVQILERMFAKHGATRVETCAFLERAASSYLPVSFAGHASDERDREQLVRRWREADASAGSRFEARGVEAQEFIPHQVALFPRGGPDGAALAERLCGITDLAALHQVRVFELPEGDMPPSGPPIAEASLAVSGDDLFVTALTNDWNRLLLNGILECALDSGVEAVFFRTDWNDRALRPVFDAERTGDWWRVPTEANEDRVARLDRRLRLDPNQPTLCITHDIERGLGHLDVEPEFAAQADRWAPEGLRRMLAAERAAGIRTTYCVVGSLLTEIRPPIEADGHTLGFHSFEHRLPDEATDAALEELVRCRQLDASIRGYRPPQSRIGRGLEDNHLVRHDFEWFASSRSSLGLERPVMENGIVKVPIHIDDFDLHRGRLTYGDWEKKVLAAARDREFVAIGLHDCYAHHWIDHYPDLLVKLGALGAFRTFDEVAEDVASGATRWSFAPHPA